MKYTIQNYTMQIVFVSLCLQISFGALASDDACFFQQENVDVRGMDISTSKIDMTACASKKDTLVQVNNLINDVCLAGRIDDVAVSVIRLLQDVGYISSTVTDISAVEAVISENLLSLTEDVAVTSCVASKTAEDVTEIAENVVHALQDIGYLSSNVTDISEIVGLIVQSLSALADNTAEVSQTVTDTADYIQIIAQNMVRVLRDLGYLSNSVTDMSAVVTLIGQSLAKIVENTAGTREVVFTTSNKVGRMAERVSCVLRDLGCLSNKVVNISQVSVVILQVLATFAGSMVGMAKQVAYTVEMTDCIAYHIGSLEQSQNSISQQLVCISEEVTEMSTAVHCLSQTTDCIHQDLACLSNDLIQSWTKISEDFIETWTRIGDVDDTSVELDAFCSVEDIDNADMSIVAWCKTIVRALWRLHSREGM